MEIRPDTRKTLRRLAVAGGTFMIVSIVTRSPWPRLSLTLIGLAVVCFLGVIITTFVAERR